MAFVWRLCADPHRILLSHSLLYAIQISKQEMLIKPLRMRRLRTNNITLARSPLRPFQQESLRGFENLRVFPVCL